MGAMGLVWLLTIVAVLMVIWVATVFIRLRGPLGWMFLFPRLTAAALVPVLAPLAVVGALLAAWRGAQAAMWLFVAAAGIASMALVAILATGSDFGTAFGSDWESRIAPARRTGLQRGAWRLQLPGAAAVTLTNDIPFWTIPETGRVLLCDIWEPPAGTAHSGLAYVYFHGSAWYFLDKDTFTRPLFRHLAAQGHVVMDVAYRLYPETEVPGMVADVNRAIAWLKEHAADYGVSPDRIVIGGSSAGGHICQLAAYAVGAPEFTPSDVQGRNLAVRGVVSLYGPTDMHACFYHTRQERIPGIGVTPPDMKALTKGSGRLGLHKAAMAGRLDWLIGGTPDQVPERYSLCSPVSHASAACPPTLLIQGEDDLVTSAAATRQLAEKLRAAGVPVATLFFPYITHGFDLAMPALSPAARRALHETDRFLAMLAG